MSKDKNTLPYRYDGNTAKALDKVKEISGIKVTTKAITHAVVNHPDLVEKLDTAQARIEELEELLNNIKQAQEVKQQVTQTLDELMKMIPEK